MLLELMCPRDGPLNQGDGQEILVRAEQSKQGCLVFLFFGNAKLGVRVR